MQELAMIMTLLWPYSFFAFAVAFIAMVVANHYGAKGDVSKTRSWTLVSAVSASLVLAFEVLSFAITLNPFAGFLILVWGYFSYMTWSRFRRLS